MPEADAVELAKERGPATRSSLAKDLRALGVGEGQTLIVHTSLSRLGWVVGGATTVIDALVDAVGDSGAIAMVASSVELSEPSDWTNPPVPESWWETIRKELPPFDRATTPVTGVGVVPAVFRTRPGVLRSSHPTGSFTAWGRHAERVVAEHPLDDMLGDSGPLGRLYELDAGILLLGVGHDSNTSLHLAEHRAGVPTKPCGSPVLIDGRREWVRYLLREYNDERFPEIAANYAAAGGTVREGAIGAGRGTLSPMREMVDFATKWLVDRGGADV